MGQPNQGKPGKPNIAQPISGETVNGNQGEVLFGHQPGGTKGTKNK